MATTGQRTPPRRARHDRREARLAMRILGRLALAVAVAAALALPALLQLLLLEASYAPLEALDRGVAEALTARVGASAGLATLWEVVAVVLHPNAYRVAVAAAVVVLWRRGARRTAVWAAVTMAGGGLLGYGVKLAVQRARPLLEDPVGTASGFSFPSLHALNALLGCGVLLLVAWPALTTARRVVAGAVAALLVLVTSYDRLALGVHFVSDVLAGWSIALAVLAATTVALGRGALPGGRRGRAGAGEGTERLAR